MRSLDSLDRYVRYALLMGEDTYASPTAQSPNTARKVTALYPSLAGDLTREQRHAKFLPGQLSSGGRIVMLEQFNWFDSATKTFTQFFLAAADAGSGTAKLYKCELGTDSDWVEVTTVGTLAAYPVGRSLNNLFHLSDGTNSWIFDGTDWVKDGLERPKDAPTILFHSTPSSFAISTIQRSNGIVTVIFTVESSAPLVPVGSYIQIYDVSGTSVFDGVFRVLTSTNVGSPAHPQITYEQTGPDELVSSDGFGVRANFSVTSNRYYWTTFADKTAGREHESSSSPRSVGTGAFTLQYVAIQGAPGTVSNTGAAVTGAGTNFTAADVGKIMYIGSGVVGGTVVSAVIQSVTDKQHLTLATSIANHVGANYLIAPARATHWRLYASASEEDKAGLLLTEQSIASPDASEVPLLQYDNSAFIGLDIASAVSYFQNIERPLRNDPPQPTLIMEIHKRRISRRRETQPNFFNFTGYEEILNLLVGAPEECVPGVDEDTISDLVNETSYPVEADRINALTSHGGALFVGTDDEITPLFGESIDDFAFSDVASFSIGVAGRHAMKTCPYGLLIGSADRKLYLYPSQTPSASNATSSLIELSRPKRPTFEGMSNTRLDEWHIVFYNWGRRNWAVTSFYDGSAYVTYIFDFETQTWIQLSSGYSCLGMFKVGVGEGKRILVGGSSDGYVYVVDDLTGDYPGSGNFAEGIFRTAPLDFGKPELDHVIYAIEYEKSDDTMPVTTTVYLDPADPDNPTDGIVVNMEKTRIGFNRYRGFINGAQGGTCHRAIVELKVAAGTVDGKLTGLAVYAEHAPLFGPK